MVSKESKLSPKLTSATICVYCCVDTNIWNFLPGGNGFVTAASLSSNNLCFHFCAKMIFWFSSCHALDQPSLLNLYPFLGCFHSCKMMYVLIAFRRVLYLHSTPWSNPWQNSMSGCRWNSQDQAGRAHGQLLHEERQQVTSQSSRTGYAVPCDYECTLITPFLHQARIQACFPCIRTRHKTSMHSDMA